MEMTRLGRYRLERELGKGAMGAVYQARDSETGRTVALKTMALGREFEGSGLDAARERFFREAETAGRLRHPHIVSIFEAGEEQGLAYIAMELLDGRDLTPYTRPDTLLPAQRVLSIVACVAQALAHAHRQGVVHRDIKPANIMFNPAGDSVKITDFGIASIAGPARSGRGVVFASPHFMSPEQMAGEAIDGRSDLYSLGVTLFQLLTGHLPFRGDSVDELMYKIANEPATDIRGLRPELPEELANVVLLAMEKRPEVRYADGEELASDLLKVAGHIAHASAIDPQGEGDAGLASNKAGHNPHDRGPHASGGRAPDNNP